MYMLFSNRKKDIEKKLNFFIDGNIINSKGKDLYVFKDKYC